MSFKPQPVALALCACMTCSLISYSSAQKAAKFSDKSAATRVQQVPADVRQAIQVAYNEQNAAFSRQDIEGYLAHRAPDYVILDDDGEGPGAEKLRKTFGVMFQGTRASSATTSILSAFSQGSGVVVLTKQHTEMTVVRPGDQKVGHLVADNWIRDFWVQVSKDWQVKRSKLMSSRQTINGQPIH